MDIRSFCVWSDLKVLSPSMPVFARDPISSPWNWLPSMLNKELKNLQKIFAKISLKYRKFVHSKLTFVIRHFFSFHSFLKVRDFCWFIMFLQHYVFLTYGTGTELSCIVPWRNCVWLFFQTTLFFVFILTFLRN